MPISSFYTTTFTVKRQTWANNKSTLATKDTFKGHLQQASAEVMQQYEGLRHTKAWEIWCAPDTDVEEGDRIEVGADTYDARFIQDRDIGSDGHLHIIVEKHDE